MPLHPTGSGCVHIVVSTSIVPLLGRNRPSKVGFFCLRILPRFPDLKAHCEIPTGRS